MSRLDRARSVTAVAAILLVTTSGCGSKGIGPGDESTEPVAVHGNWLLRFGTASGADGEKSGAVYVSYDPTTGAATARKVPGTTAADASQDEQALLVSADHAWAIPDTGVPPSQGRLGKGVLYSLTSDATQTLDIRAATGDPKLQAIAWAFDPSDGNLLRIVDRARGVWDVDLTAKSATKEGQLAKRPGWIFGDGFDKTTGEPYIESIDSDQTEPAGNGDSDVRPLERQGGTVLQYDGADLPGVPKPPCGFAGAFQDDDGSAWLFCADTPSISAYRLDAGGTSWHAYGKPSAKIVPALAVELTFALPPVG